MVFNTTFNNISLISWRSVLLVEETGIHRENFFETLYEWNLYPIKINTGQTEIHMFQNKKITTEIHMFQNKTFFFYLF